MMKDKTNIKNNISKRPTWQQYQAELNRIDATRKFTKRFPLYLLGIFVFFLAVYGIIRGYSVIENHFFSDATAALQKNVYSEKIKKGLMNSRHQLAKDDIQELLNANNFTNLKEKGFNYKENDINVWVETSLDMDLQKFLFEKLNKKTSRNIGIVAMDPDTGKILAMVGFDKKSSSSNTCVNTLFPAASIFKIVTAVAAIEECHLNSNSTLKYNGGKHTLYKSQLKDSTNKYTRKITLKDSFAQSINPVFGKIGANLLGKAALEKYAKAFGFNQTIGFEIPILPSNISLTNEPYQWAEVASGFNQSTNISPIHGALITSAILNQGNLMEPSIIEQITNVDGKTLYMGEPVVIHQAFTPKTSKIINNLMVATITSGTGKNLFKGYNKDKVLSKLKIGGKTGSINNDPRYDWFVGFAEEKNGSAKFVISVVVAHEKYIGTRAGHYARMAIKYHFRDDMAENRPNTKKTAG